MKRICYQVFVGSLVITQISSCSWISSRRTLFGGDKEKSPEMATVPKSQYDQLLKKYQSVLDERRLEKAGGQEQQALVSDIEKKSISDPSALVDELEKVNGTNAELAETVDVFGKKGLVRKDIPPPMPVNVAGTQVEAQIKKLRKAERLLGQNKYDASLANLKELENSPIAQVRVRAKFLMGELLFRQKEYDLSMQIFEEILHRDAFSSVVLKSLGRLVVCSEKLKLKKKQETYYSMLHDFFESE